MTIHKTQQPTSDLNNTAKVNDNNVNNTTKINIKSIVEDVTYLADKYRRRENQTLTLTNIAAYIARTTRVGIYRNDDIVFVVSHVNLLISTPDTEHVIDTEANLVNVLLTLTMEVNDPVIMNKISETFELIQMEMDEYDVKLQAQMNQYQNMPMNQPPIQRAVYPSR